MSDGEKRIAAYHRAMGDTQIIAARKTGIHEDSIGRWERAADSVYREAYEEAIQRVLTEVYSEALAVMRAELGSDEALARWRAANSLLNHIARLSVRRSEVVHKDTWSMQAILLDDRDATEDEDDDLIALGPAESEEGIEDEQFSPEALLRAIR